jgi:uncharacterized membrane protein YphA (DoxX/SURF4 family)
MSLAALLKAWDDWFFKPVSPLPVALLRILFGTFLLIMMVTQYMPDWDFWYGPESPVNTDMLRDFFFRCPVFDLFDILPGELSHVFMWTLLGAAFCLTIGLFTRISSVFVWLALVTLDHHNPWNICGCDDMMRLVAFCLMFTYCGEMLSVDNWLKRKFDPEEVKTAFPPWGQRMVQIQLALAYWGASTAKLGGNQWIDGVAVYYSAHYEDFFRFPVGHLFDNLAVCQFLSWSTLVIEVALWTLIWFKEFRYWVLLAGVLLHIGIDYSMSLPIFEMLFVACYLTFIEPEDLMRLWRWLHKPTFTFTIRRVTHKAPQAVTLPAVQAVAMPDGPTGGTVNDH